MTISIFKMFSSCSPGSLVNPLVAETAIRGRYSVCCWEHFWSEEERAGVADGSGGSGPRPSQAKKTPILPIVVPKSERGKLNYRAISLIWDERLLGLLVSSSPPPRPPPFLFRRFFLI